MPPHAMTSSPTTPRSPSSRGAGVGRAARAAARRAADSRAAGAGAGPAGGCKSRGRGLPRHTVRQVALRAAAALALPPGPGRLAAEAEAAAEVCLLPYTFTSWTDALESELMPVREGVCVRAWGLCARAH